MTATFTHGLIVGGLIAGAFAAGLCLAPEAGVLSAAERPALVLPQGRGTPTVSPPPTTSTPIDPTAAAADAPAPLVYGGDAGQSAAANGFIAVTGSYGVGTSVLYVLDTDGRQLAVYEARGGSANTRRLVFVGARRIDLDLQLHAYNDKSEYTYDDLAREFERRGRSADGSGQGAPAAETGADAVKAGETAGGK